MTVLALNVSYKSLLLRETSDDCHIVFINAPLVNLVDVIYNVLCFSLPNLRRINIKSVLLQLLKVQKIKQIAFVKKT